VDWLSLADRRAGVSREPWPRRFRTTLALVGSAVVLATIAQTPPGRSVLRLTGMVQADPGYSSLYFPSVEQFPSGLLDGEDSFPVTFAIGNSAQRSQGYRWSIQAVDQGKTRTVNAGTASVAANATSVVQQTVQTSCTGHSMKVVVLLTAPGEHDDSIDFLATCTPSTNGAAGVSTAAGGASTGPAKSSSGTGRSSSRASGL
jgi:hypothetical protein